MCFAGESAYRHTAGNNYPLRGGKYSFFEGGVRCPAFVYAPGILSNSSAGQIIDSYAHVSDWYTTLTDLVNAPLSTGERKGLDGQLSYFGLKHVVCEPQMFLNHASLKVTTFGQL